MEHDHQLSDRLHFVDLAREAVWVDDEHSRLDAEHAQALFRMGFGFAGARFSDQAC